MRTPAPRRPFLALAFGLLLASGGAGAEEGTCPQLEFASDAPELILDDRLVLTADEVLLEEDGVSNLAGMVKLRQGDKIFAAENLNYDETTRQITVKSESLFRNRSLIIKSQSATFDLNAESGSFFDNEFTLPERAARGEAKRITLSADGYARLDGSVYTTCAPDSDAWYLQASRIRLDYEDGLGTARNARLRFHGVPILYLPWFQFPIDDRRRTGLLYPTVGQSSDTGFEVRWPIYLNLGPNYDATVTPRQMADRGLQMGNDFRYLLRSGEGQARYEFLDDRKLKDNRSLFRFENRGLFNDRLGYETNYAETSDRQYFEDLGGSFESASITHLEQSARLIYQAPNAYSIRGLVQNFQPIATNLEAVDDPYKRLPQIRVDGLTKNSFLDTRAGLGSEFVNFARDNSVEGTRINLQPYLRFARERRAWYLRSQADLNYTAYDLKDEGSDRGETPTRTLPVLSAETGLRFERLTPKGRLQLLEPRGFALYVPFDDQSDLPLFDTGEPDFDFVQLFARNRFSGEDRVADARHVAGAVTLRELDPESGLTRWSASAGQLYRFTDPRVTIPGFDGPDSGATEFIGEFAYRWTGHWSTVLAGQWSPTEEQFERSNFSVRYSDPDRGRSIRAAYRYRRGILEQTDLSFATPVFGSWKIAARSRFSLQESETLDTLVGVEYGTCCWALRTSYRRFIANTSGEYDSGVYVQLELKGLTQIGATGSGLIPGEDDGGDRLY